MTRPTRLEMLPSLLLLVLFFIQGCATNLTKPSGLPQPSRAKFSEFQAVEMKHVYIDPKFKSSSDDQRASKKIDELLFTNMRQIFPNFREAEDTSSSQKQETRTLLIEPVIKEVKFVSVGVRIMVGPMAGGTAILMKVTYRDKATGEIIAEPEFYRDSSAWAGAFAIADNQVLGIIVQDILNYTNLNR